MELTPGQHVFFAGIGGISMSGLAHALLERGFAVSGSDLAEGPVTARLRRAGARVHIGHAEGNIAGADIVVRTTAVPETSPEIAAARRAGVPVYHRSELLAWMCRGKRGIAITGTHGKSTTTAMAATVFIAAGCDPTVFVGAEMPLLGGVHRLGRGPHVIFEACESDRSFLNYGGASQVITSCEADHLDQHGTLEGLREAFERFAELADPDGFVVYNADCPATREIVEHSPARRIAVSLEGAAALGARDIRVHPDGTEFTLLCEGDAVAAVRLPVPGAHNVRNALAALGCALGSELDPVAACAALAEYRPIGRRFEEVGSRNGYRVVDDYAHHPTEVRATLAAARAVHPGRLVAVFQPHLRSRTRDLLGEFGAAFHDADVVVLTDIYQPREDGLAELDITCLEAEIRRNEPGKPVELIRDKSEIASRLRPRLMPGDLVMTIGAGDIWKAGRELASDEG